jgi:putative restriction endonuclease
MAFGEVAGNPEGTVFRDRAAARAAGVHLPNQHGIAGRSAVGAESIVVSGGYEDDEDYGTLIIYTGAGGQNERGEQVADQSFTAQNLALAKSSTDGLPVRVIRGSRGDPGFRPPTGYRYDGLYAVTRYWRETGRSGFQVCRYELRKILSDGSLAETPANALPPGPAPRALMTTERIVRESQVTRAVKRLHDNICQICGNSIATPTGTYAEGAHIRPLGRPHDGPDVEANVICLCPDDHVRFDRGAIVVTDALEITDTLTGTQLGQLRTVAGHTIDAANIRYHREHFTIN